MRNKGGSDSTPLGVEDRDPASLSAALLTDARLYLKAAEALAAQEIWSPEYFLLCHATELILKSYLACHGATEKELRQLGHRLLRTYSRARKKGFCPTDVRTTEVIRWLSPFHEVLFFRYRKGSGFVQYPAPNEVAEVVSSLIRQIDPIVRSRFRASRTRR
jgi:hypothetical protein